LFAEKSIYRIIILHLIAIFFVTFNVSDIKIAGLSKLVPLFDVMMVFYFTVFRQVFFVWFLFLIGIWSDSLNGIALGITPLLYIVLTKFFIVLNQKVIMRENFKQIWQQFVAFCFCFLFFKWALLSIFGKGSYSFMTIFIQFILTSCIYVVMHKFFDYLNQKLLEER